MMQYYDFTVNNLSGMHLRDVKSGLHCHTLF